MTGIIPSYLTLFGLEGSYAAWWFFIIIIFSFLSYLISEHWGSRGIVHRAGRLQLALGWSFFLTGIPGWRDTVLAHILGFCLVLR